MSASRNSKKNDDRFYWLITIFLLLSGWGTLFGLIMGAMKLFGNSKSSAQKAQTVRTGARTTRNVYHTSTAAAPDRTAANQQAQIKKLLKKGKRLTIAGTILTVLFGLTTLNSAVSCLWMLPDVAWYLSELMPTLCFTGIGLGCLWAGSRKRGQGRRFRNYLAMIGRQQAVSVSALASAAGCPADQVRDDLEDMLSDGLFPQGFLDYGSDRLILSFEGLRPEPKPQPEPTQEERENAILTEIRQVNDAIRNEKMSAQIDRIGVITAKILDYQKSNPNKAPQLHSFLSYYLPTTLKILRAYAQLEAQEVAGENINAAMKRIEGMMDKVVEGFEKQLDLLFQGDAMDITTDVEVLERMLAKDGLAGQEGMTLGL